MSQTIIIAGSGFAGMWAALSASRAISLADKEGEIEVVVVSPLPHLTIRPRLYEASLENMAPDIAPLFAAVGVQHVTGLIETIDVEDRLVTIAAADGTHQTRPYDRFVLAAGSQVFRPDIPGLPEYGFDTDQLDAALRLDAHLKALAGKPDTAARNTVVVAGGGLTGIEVAAELPGRLRAELGAEAAIRVILIDTADVVGASMGAGPQPHVQEALAQCGVESRCGVRVSAVTADSVTLSSGERISADTLVWAAGMRASPLAAQIPGDHDALGRVIGDAWLHAPAAKAVFVTGDAVKVPTDDQGAFNVMSCQHALSLGRVAGHNAAAELVGLPLHPYSQPKYVTCLDLGAWGALYTEGWDRNVVLTGEEAKALKREINTKWIYPPAPDRDAVFAIANPDFVIVP